MNSKTIIYGLIVLLLNGIFFILSLMAGSVAIPIEEVVNAIFGSGNEVSVSIVKEHRLPSSLVAMLAGASLGVSGLLMQSFFRNPVVGPYVLGISSGASLGVAFLLLGGGVLGFSISPAFMESINIIFAIAGSLLVFTIIILFANRLRSIVSLLIVGLMVGALINASITVLQSFSTKSELQDFVFWNFGSFYNANYNEIAWFFVLAVLAITGSMAISKNLNVLILGEDGAAISGLNVKTNRNLILVFSSVLAAITTAICGPIAFIGLAVPHIVKMSIKESNHLYLIPLTVLTGSLVCLACLLIGKLQLGGFSIPLNAITSLIGAPLVIYIIVRSKMSGYA